MQETDRVVGHLVRRALDLVDVVRSRFHLAEIGHERLEFAAAAHDVLGVGVEQVIEAPLSRHQPSKHRVSSVFWG
jgi:hypothetical protein